MGSNPLRPARIGTLPMCEGRLTPAQRIPSQFERFAFCIWHSICTPSQDKQAAIALRMSVPGFGLLRGCRYLDAIEGQTDSSSSTVRSDARPAQRSNAHHLPALKAGGGL
jgi:hypothetical protein